MLNLTFNSYINYICYVIVIKVQMMDDNEWKRNAKNILKAELTRLGVSYDVLVKKLNAIGVDENYNTVNTKINRGTFSFVFFVQCMKALDIKLVRFD